jgi:hypothetical protein
MKGTNSALRREPAEEQPEPLAQGQKLRQAAAGQARRRPPRPRRSLAFRALGMRDQGLQPFRCR